MSSTDNQSSIGSQTSPSPQNGHRDGKPNSYGGVFWRAVLIIVVIIAIMLIAGIIPRMRNASALKDSSAKASETLTIVNVAKPTKAPATDVLNLPGNIQAVQQTAIAARATGYLKQWYVDLGDKVQKGQLLATIESPEVDQALAQAQAQLSQARASVAQALANITGNQGDLAQAQANYSRSLASLAQANQALAQNRAQYAQAQGASDQQKAQLDLAKANLALAKVTAMRYQKLAADGAIDQQTADQTQASYETNSANVEALAASLRASQANVEAFSAGVRAGQANVSSFAEGVNAAKAAVATAEANVGASRAAYNASQANVVSNQANVARSQALQGFEQVTAPFDGVITARNVDTGGLIGSSASSSSSGGSVGGSSGPASGGGLGSTTALGGTASSGPSSSSSTSPGSSGSLFSEAQNDVLRVYVNVPQTYFSEIVPGLATKITVHEYPLRKFDATIARTAGALDPATRTLVTEVQLQNKSGLLRPGMFAQVAITIPHTGASILIPDSAIVTNAAGISVATLVPGNKAHFVPVTVGRDFGAVIEIVSGLTENNQVITNPTSDLHEGQKVQVAQAVAPAAH